MSKKRAATLKAPGAVPQECPLGFFLSPCLRGSIGLLTAETKNV